ncbi:MAG: hypothetical protein C0410_08185 [Anaerolinea sp.]|nr:hypothetical protein [Anaerolinea sp.]
MKIISWQYLLTDHQIYTWCEMQKRGHEVLFVLGRTQDENRSKQGWSDTALDSLATITLPLKDWWKFGKEIIENDKSAVHIFCGFWADKRFFPLIMYALRKGVKTVLMNESYAEVQTGYLKEENKIKTGIKVHLRPLLYKTAIQLCKLVSKNNPLRVLSIGQQAKEQFQKAGVDKLNIFPWGYFVPQKDNVEKKSSGSKTQRVVFVGNLQHRKGLDLAIKAIDEVNRRNPQPVLILDVYGPGDNNQWISSSSREIVYKGIIPFGHSQEILAQYDYLILPSRHDGWGVVINEALLQGVPVIVSDSVGAKSLVVKSNAGLVFKSEDIEDLVRVLEDIVFNPKKHEEYSKNASLVALKILPSEAAQYLEEILDFTFHGSGQRPVPNWER